LRALGWNVAIAALWFVVYARSARQLFEFSVTHSWCPHLIARQAPLIMRCLEARQPEAKILDSSDGVFAFFLDVPAEPATALTATAAGHRVRMEHGLGAYYKALIQQGYTVNTVSGLCDSGHIPPILIEQHIDCRQGRSIPIQVNQLALPKPRGAQRGKK
jgi:hypothetical protein